MGHPHQIPKSQPNPNPGPLKDPWHENVTYTVNIKRDRSKPNASVPTVKQVTVKTGRGR